MCCFLQSEGIVSVLGNTSIAHVHFYPESGALSSQALADHLRDVAELAAHFAKKADIPLAGYLAGLVHDFGKYSVSFQKYILSACGYIDGASPEYLDPVRYKGKIDHSTAGAQRLWRAFAGNPACKPLAQLLALCVFSHHSGLQDCINTQGEDSFSQRISKADEKTHFTECLERCDAAILQELGHLLQFPVIKELDTAIRGLHKRIEERLGPDASDTDTTDNKKSRAFQQGLLARFLLSCLLDADRTNSAEFEDPVWKAQRTRLPKVPWERLVPKLEAHLAGFEQKHAIDGLRHDISEQCAKRAEDAKGLFTLTVPTGGGKTLASLRFALRHAHKHRLDRVVYVIPYTSIIDQNAKVARDILEKGEEEGSIVLEHHSNIIPKEADAGRKGGNGDDGGGGDSTADQWDKLSENWESPVVFTTMVQFLESLFASGTRQARRMHNLANSVLIFDEIQTLPVRCLRMFCNAIDFLVNTCGASVVLCTATQPRFEAVPRAQLGSLPLTPEKEIISNVSELFARLKRTDFFDHCSRDMSAEDIANLALEELGQSGSCLVVCNTKSMAKQIHAFCAEHAERQGASLYYLSTNLCPAHRLENLEAMRAELDADNGKPVLCISTQLIECGVDISFGSVVRLAAGLDSILQAAGRCNRNGGVTPGRVHIVKSQAEDKGLNYLYDIKSGRDIFLNNVRIGLSKELQSSGNDFTRPNVIATYFTQYFQRRHDVMEYSCGESNRSETLLNMLGSNNNVAVTAQGDFSFKQSFASAAKIFRAIDQNTTAVIVPYGKGESIITELCSSQLFYRKKELLRKAQRYSVNLFPHTVQELERQNALHTIQDSGILSLNKRFYSEATGVVTMPASDSRLSFLES